MEFAAQMRSTIIQQIGTERYELWFGCRVEFQLTESQLTIAADTPFRIDRLRKGLLRDIKAAMAKLHVDHVPLEFVVDSSLGELPLPTPLPQSGDVDFPCLPSPVPETRKDPNHSQAEQACRSDEQIGSSPERLRRGRPFQSLDSFVVGECNELAMSSIQLVTRQLGGVSPLIVHGPSGVGKTHLLEGVWRQIRRSHPRFRVVYLSAEQFTSYFLEALRGGSGLPNFRRKYRQADVLMIDDIQFFAGKQATLVEFNYTIEALAREGRQLILTADQPLQQLTSLGKELIARLSGGLLCGIKPLDHETMKGLSIRWAAERRIVMDDSVHTLVASRMRGDARQLSGILNRLQAMAMATHSPITMRMANEVLQELIPRESRIVRLQDVRQAVCRVFAISPDQFQSDGRGRKVTQPRMLAMWLARKHTSAGLHEISEFFGRRSHSSAVTAHKTVEKWIADDLMMSIPHRSGHVIDVIGMVESLLLNEGSRQLKQA